MNWVDVCGPPGSGKSTLCDPLWGPHEIPIVDGVPPAEWHDFLNEITRLFLLVRKHPSFVAALRMNNRSLRKIATVARSQVAVANNLPYIQTALIQRGFGFGWRLNQLGADPDEMRHYFRLMPVSVGAAFIRCPEEIVIERNHARERVDETAHENRDFMVPLMQPCIELAFEVLHERNVPIIELNTIKPVEETRARLSKFASQEPFDPEAGRLGDKVAAISSPSWWQ